MPCKRDQDQRGVCASTHTSCMHIPSIPGYETQDLPSTLAHLWARPDGDYPTGLWPETELLRIRPDPTGWLTIEENFYRGDDMYGGTHCVLIAAGSGNHFFQSGTHWSGRSDIGKVEVWGDGKFSDGLTCDRNGTKVWPSSLLFVNTTGSCSRPSRSRRLFSGTGMLSPLTAAGHTSTRQGAASN